MLPERSAFLREDRPASASVTVQLVPGKTLKKDQVRGISALVGGAVDGLELFPVDAALENRIRRRALGWTEDESTCAQAGQRVFDRFVSTYPECFGVHGE